VVCRAIPRQNGPWGRFFGVARLSGSG